MSDNLDYQGSGEYWGEDPKTWVKEFVDQRTTALENRIVWKFFGWIVGLGIAIVGAILAFVFNISDLMP